LKILIVGAGDVGFHIAKRLSEEKHDVILIDRDASKIKRVNENLDIKALLGYGTRASLLQEAGIANADMLIAVTDSDEVNLVACMIARKLNPVMTKVARVRNDEYLNPNLFDRELLGIDHIISPEHVLVRNILDLIEVPGASEVVDFVEGRVKLVGLIVSKFSPLKGTPLSSLQNLKGTFLIGAVVRGGRLFIPRGQDIIKPGDFLYLVMKAEEVSDVLADVFKISQEPVARVLIVGAGQAGTELANLLEKTKIAVKLFEKDPQKCTQLAEILEKTIVINGDGTDQDLLIEENIGEMDLVVALTEDEENNVFVSLLAKALGAKRTITRISKISYLPIISTLGIDPVVNTRLSAVRAILQNIRKGRVISVAPLKGEHAEAIEAEALETSDIVNIPLSRVGFPKGAILATIVRGDEVIIPRGDTIVLPGDRLIMLALRNALPKLERLLTVKLEYF
jgi:trk system potassium uptake protein TrkA